MILIPSLILASFWGVQQHSTDTLPGQLVTTVTTQGTFVMFDKQHPDRFFFRDASDQMEMDVVLTQPEADLFLADHAKDDLKITYQTRDVPKPGGGTERLYFETMLRSLRTGDNLKDWPQKLAADSSRLRRCQQELEDIRSVE